MASENRAELVKEANELGLEFPANIPSKKLEDLIAESAGPAVKPASEEKVYSKKEPTAVLSKIQKRRQFVAKRKAQAMKTSIVTITNKDNRDNDFTTTASLSFENQFFGLAKNVPLDVPVELEQALINIAETTLITHHKAEVVEGRRTGNKIPIQVKKYVVSYEKI